MKYIQPEKNLGAFTCPHCHTLSLQKKTYYTCEEDRDEYFGLYEFSNSCTLHILRCQCCTKKTIWIGDEYIYPDILQEEPNQDMPESVLKLYKEAGCIYSKSPRAACALLRLAIDKLCNELGEVDSKIDKNISELVKKGLPIKIQKALDIVRVVGNKAVHPGQIDFDIDDIATAQMLFKLINMIVTSLITEPKELDGLYEKLPENAKEAIKRRDK